MIVIPMVGKSQRFTNAGYTVPKYQLPLWGETVFYHVVKSFEHYFETERFVFICRKDHKIADFIEESTRQLGVRDVSIVEIDRDTSGQAETVLLGLKNCAGDEEFYVFNIDTIRPQFRKPNLKPGAVGHLEVFEGEGDHWSFIRANEADEVIETTEKKRISNLCSDGIYYFSTVDLFRKVYKTHFDSAGTVNGETYIAPMYNTVIHDGGCVTYNSISLDEIIFCGTPLEFEEAARRLPVTIFGETPPSAI